MSLLFYFAVTFDRVVIVLPQRVATQSDSERA